MSYTVTFDIKDDKSNVLGCDAVLDEFTTAEFETGTLTDVEADSNTLKLTPLTLSDFFSDAELWLDASDSNSLTLDGSNNVEEWADKSGNSRDASQGTAANRPSVASAELNGLDVLRFDGGNDYLQTADWGDQSQPNTVFIVAKHPPNDSTQRFLCSPRVWG